MKKKQASWVYVKPAPQPEPQPEPIEQVEEVKPEEREAQNG
jgi:hypothetical protein